MTRKELVPQLLDQPRSLRELSALLAQPLRATESDLRHLFKSLERSEYRVEITPARCRKCDFSFDPRHLRRPGKCPKCRGTWIADALVAITAR